MIKFICAIILEYVIDLKVLQPYTRDCTRLRIEPTSSLSNFVPPKVIELANIEVEKVKNKEPRDTIVCVADPFMCLRCIKGLATPD